MRTIFERILLLHLFDMKLNSHVAAAVTRYQVRFGMLLLVQTQLVDAFETAAAKIMTRIVNQTLVLVQQHINRYFNIKLVFST